MKSYLDIISILNDFANKHEQLKKFLSGIPDNVSSIFDKMDKMYPAMWIQPVDFELKENTISYNLEIHIFSLDHEGRDDSEVVLSDMVFIANDLFNYLYKSYEDYLGSDTAKLNPIFFDYSERVTGVTMQLNILVNRESSICNIPLNNS